MRQIIYILLVGIFFVTACETAPKSTTVIPSKTLTFDSIQTKFDTINLGRINEGETVTGKFAVKNSFDKPIVIGDIITSCGCTTTKFDKKPILQGEERIVEFAFDSKGREGWTLKNIDVITTDHLITRVFIEAEIVRP